MKILLAGDQHRTFTAPANRKDDYAAAVKAKALNIIDIAVNNQCAYIVYPGDVFDSHKVPYGVVEHFLQVERWAATTMATFGVAPVPLYVFGQHDQRYHTGEKKNTPLGALLAGSNGTLLGAAPYIDHENKTAFYGASWGEDIPEILPSTQEMFNVLVTHRMIIGDKKLWDEQEDYTKSSALLKDTQFGLVVTGDNHQRVIQQDVRKRAVVNMGSLMRSTTAQLDHKPAVVIFNTNTKAMEVVELQVPPAAMVFSIEKVTARKEQDAKIAEFVQTLRFASAGTLDFTKNLADFMTENKVADDVRDTIRQMLPENTKLEV